MQTTKKTFPALVTQCCDRHVIHQTNHLVAWALTAAGLACASCADSNGSHGPAFEPPSTTTLAADASDAEARIEFDSAGDAVGDDSVDAADAQPPTSCQGGPAQVAIHTLKRIYTPRPSPDGGAWYINDHAIIHGPDNLWHMFGITHQEPLDPLNETVFAHATSPTLTATDWTEHPPALTADPRFGETQLWAPYVISFQNVFYMFYCGGGTSEQAYQIELATSKDLWTWTRSPAPLFIDGYQARDPFVLRVGAVWVLYYTATISPSGGNHIVAYRTSTDLLTWSDSHIAFQDPTTGNAGGPTESPFIVPYGSGYYLFTGPRSTYTSTGIFYSVNPLHFDPSGALPTPQNPLLLQTHASEIVVDLDGRYYITHAGWGQGGLWIGELTWTCP